VHSGTIAGGLGGDGVTRAAAIEFTGGSNSLTLNAGASLLGAIAIESGRHGQRDRRRRRPEPGQRAAAGRHGHHRHQRPRLGWSGPSRAPATW
jgi:hypothetical protein